MRRILVFLICLCLFGCGPSQDQRKKLKGTWELVGNSSMKLSFTEDGNQVFFVEDETSFVFDMTWLGGKWQLKQCTFPNRLKLRIGITSDEEICIAPINSDETEYHQICGRYKRSPFDIDIDALELQID